MVAKIGPQILEDITASIPGVVYQFMVRPDGSWLLNFVSKGIETLFEVTQEDACRGEDILTRCVIDEDRLSHRQSVDYALQKLLPWHHEYRIRTSSGVLKWIRGTALQQQLPDGSTLWNGILSDITEHRRAEEALQEEKEKFSLAFQAVPSVLVITSLVDGRYMEVNEAFERVMGYRRDEVIGRCSLDFNTWQNPEERVRMLRMLDEGEKVRDLEVGFRSKSGADLVGLYSAEIIEIGAERCLLSLANDITARKKAEEELRRSEERYRRLYKETPVMLHSIDHDWQLVSVSNYWLDTLGYESNEVLGRRITEFHTEGSRRYAKEVVLPEFFRTGSCKEVPYQLVNKNGEILDVLLSAIAERNDEGKIVRTLAVMIDVTERKRAQEEIEKLNTDLAARAIELENANRELETFSYSVSHDLRKPLTIISSYSQIILELCGHNLDTQCQEYLHGIHNGTESMDQLIDALLKFSFLMHTELHREDVDLSKIADTVAGGLALTEPGRRVTFRISKGITANGDTNLLRVVMENLLGNAWKYTGKQEEAVIEFGMMEVEGIQTYFIRDNGTGFDMANADKLFKPFQRLHRMEAEGHGIGLATVERIVKRHGGKVWAEGEPDKGSTFYFTL
jgi:PAS domain S-box-containing protein